MSQGNLEGLLNCSLEKLKGLVDVNTIIGQPITAPDGTIIVPCQKWRLATAPEAAILAGISPKDMFGGGSGAGVSIQPLAFLVIQEGNVRLLQMQNYDNTADRAVGIVPDLIDKFADIFSKSKKEKGEQ